MTIATKNGSVILKSGSVAQNCGCCEEGACCNGTTCSVKPQSQCNAAAGEVFKGVGTVCSPNPCIGSCCLPNKDCIVTSQQECNDLGGSWTQGGSCEPYLCSPCALGHCPREAPYCCDGRCQESVPLPANECTMQLAGESCEHQGNESNFSVSVPAAAHVAEFAVVLNRAPIVNFFDQISVTVTVTLGTETKSVFVSNHVLQEVAAGPPRLVLTSAALFDKPPGVTSASVSVSASYNGFAALPCRTNFEGASIAAWIVEYYCLDRCAGNAFPPIINPLP